MDLLQPESAPVVPEYEFLEPGDRKKVVAHYALVAPLIAAAFGEIPLTTLFLPDGFDGDEVRVGRLHDGAPAKISTVRVETADGPFSYVALTVDSIV